MYNFRYGVPSLFFLIYSLFTAPVVVADSAVIDQHIDKLIPVFENGSHIQVKRSVNSLAWTGISSPRLFDVVQARLLDNYRLTSKTDIALSGWLIKALSYSGNDKYRSTLEKMLDETVARKVRGYGETALQNLQRFKRWNSEISQGLTGLDQVQTEQQRVRNMLASADMELLRVGAKRIYHVYNANQVLLKLAESRLVKEYRADNDDSVFIDTMAWLCKALAHSGDAQYKATLVAIEQNTSNRKLRKYAKKYAAQL